MNTKEICLRLQLTPRIVQWWCETGLIHCDFQAVQGNGHARAFDAQQALIVGIVAELRRKGLPLARIRDLRLRFPKADYLVVLKDHGAAIWCEEDAVIERMARARGPCVVVCLKDLRATLWPTPETSGSQPSRAAMQTL